MMKLILFAVIGLLVGVGGGSAVSVLKARKAFASVVAQRAKVVADSIAKVAEAGSTRASPAPRGTEPPAPADSSAASDAAAGDSTAHGAGRVATNARIATRADSAVPSPAGAHGPMATVAHPPAYSRAVQTVESNGIPPAGPRTATVPALPSKPIVTAATQPGMARVAKILAAMPPKDAAKVLEQLDDADVQGVIEVLNDKQAAAILRNLPPLRAAQVSKGVLRAPGAKP